jgi:formate hydrogenlyase transcriptional activator
MPDVPDGSAGVERRREPDADNPRGSTDLGESPEQPAADPGESQQYRLLLEINNAIISNLTRESLFRAITEALRKIVPFDRAVLYDAEKDTLRTFALEGPELLGHAHDLHRDISRQGTAAGWVLEHRQSRLRRNLEAEDRLPGDEIMVAGGVRAYLCVPLMARGRAIGALLLQSFAPSRYSPADVLLLEEVAKQIALAVENMRAYEEIARLRAKLEEENRYLQEEIKSDHNFEEIIGQSRAIKEVFRAVEAVAPAGATVLITGETGTGKELVARALHNLSPRRGKALIKVNCAALPAGLIESELFGHEKGAFTGAIARKIGRFELAHAGTLFLDEIGDLPVELQPKLLRVLQEGEFERIGASRATTVDVRVVAATNRDLETAVQEGRFRSDLYYRLNVFPIRLPPLRERTEDIPLLVRYLTLKYGPRLGKRISDFPPAIMEVLQTYSWPGNVRELENVIERATILSAGAELDLSWWPMTTGARSRGSGTRTLQEVERDHIRAVLELTGWRVSGEKGAAAQLGMKPTTLEARMKKLGIRRKE